MYKSWVVRFFYRISSAIEPYNKFVLALAILMICLAGHRFYSQHLDLSAASLIPDSSPELARVSNFMDINPNSRATVVEFFSQSSDDAELMQEMAGQLAEALSEYIEESRVGNMPKADKLVAMLPYLFDEEAQAKVERKSTPEAIFESIKGVRTAMSGLYGFAPKEFLRADPLGWLSIISDKVDGELFSGSSFDPINLHGYPVSDDGRYVLLILRPKSNLYDVESASETIRIIESKFEELFAPYDGRIQGRVIGGMRYTADNAVTIERDLRFTISLSLVCLAIIYIFTVRSLGAIWLLLTPVVAIIFAGSAITLFWPTTAGLALAFGAAVLGIAVDFAVLVHFALRRNIGTFSRPAVIASVSRPMVFSASLCIASFCVLTLSSLPTMRQLGFFAAVSLVAGVLIATMILPYCPWIDKPKLKPLERCADECALNPKPSVVIALFILLASVCAWGMSQVKFDMSVQRLGTNTDKINEEVDDLRARWHMGTEPMFWLNSSPTMDEALTDGALLAKTIRDHGGVAFSLADVLPPAKVQRENMARWNEFMRERGANIQDALAKASEDNGFKRSAFRNFDDWLNDQRREAIAGRLVYSPNALRTFVEEAGLGEFFWWMSTEGNGEYFVFTYSNISLEKAQLPAQIRDNALLFSMHELTDGIAKAFNDDIRILPIAGVICFVLLYLCFRRPLWVLLASLPPLFGLCSILIWQFVSGSDLTIAGLGALTLVIGLGADYGIVMLHELSSRMSFGAFRSILVSGLTTLSGLGVLILADHPVLSELGGVTFFGLTAEMIAVLLFVPFICRKGKKNV